MIQYKELRKLTMLTCAWCKRRFCAERSDRKYCCDSHKTMACVKRGKDKIKKRLEDQEAHRQWQIAQKQLAILEEKILAKEKIDRQNHDNDMKAMHEMMAEMKQELKLNGEKREFEHQWKQLNSIAVEFLRLSTYGSISAREIRSLGEKSDEIIDNEKIKQNPALQKHWLFIDDVFSVYLNELSDLEDKSDSRRLEFKAPAEIISGMQMLMEPVPFPG